MMQRSYLELVLHPQKAHREYSVGAAIVNEDKVVVGIGYNGFPIGCSDDELPWARTAERELDTKSQTSLIDTGAY